MRIGPVLATLLLALPASAAAQAPGPAPSSSPQPAPARVPVYGYEVVRTFPHDPTAFTQGLVIRDGVLIESTGRNPSSVRRVRLEDGVVLQKRELEPEYFGEGLTEKDGRVFSLSWINGVGFIWNADDLKPVSRFTYAGEGWGLTHDGTRLILSDGSAALRFLDLDTQAETGRASAMEESMLDFAENVQPNSRLSCQIRVSDDLDGLIVRLPESQH